MDNANEELAKRLHEVLDVIGATEFIRKQYLETSMLYEIPLMFSSHFYKEQPFKNSVYIVGSSCEGTTTPGLHSDIDMLWCDENSPVVDNLVDAKQHGMSYFILIDEYTKPGYVSLQKVKDTRPLYVGMCDVAQDNSSKIDRKGRICLTHLALLNELNLTRNGPAVTIPAKHGSRQRDLVYALRCRQIPRSANSWLKRTHAYSWPSQKQLKTLGSYGCFLVGVGHPHSNYKSIEWRISFSLQERDLMSTLNETQHKCYILLKMVKKSIIESKAGESISSYHCKTSLFYTIENSQNHIWKYGNLIMCVRMCLIRLFNWVKAKYCPNYFIPEANMFDKICPMTLKKTENVLRHTIHSGVTFLYSITCDNVGEMLKVKLCGSELVCSLENRSTSCTYNADIVYFVRNVVLQSMCISSNTYTGYLNETKQLLFYLQNTKHVTEHTKRDVRMALDSVIPHIQLQYQQCLFSNYLSQGDLFRVRTNTIPNIISEISDCDLISSKLSVASLYIQYEQLEEECKSILLACEQLLEPYVISICNCNAHICFDNPALGERLRDTDISSKDFRRHCTTGCMIFMPSQVSLVHKALQYEMFRTVYTQPGSYYDTIKDYWLNLITVDSQIYLYFLQYLLFSKTEKGAETDAALWKLLLVLNTDRNIGHKETGFNLFGWICLQGNDLRKAWILFCVSWTIRPFINAAKWHMLILLSEKIKGKPDY